jgi:hypothetical protein
VPPPPEDDDDDAGEDSISNVAHNGNKHIWGTDNRTSAFLITQLLLIFYFTTTDHKKSYCYSTAL